MKKIQYLLLGLLVLGSACSKPKAEKTEILFGTHTLESDSSVLFVSDYISNVENIDKISIHPKHIKTELSSDKQKVWFIRSPESDSYLYNLDFHSKDGVKSLLVKNPKKEKVTFFFEPKTSEVKEVQIRGEMNNWNASSSNFGFTNGRFSFEMLLSPGDYQYLFVVDGKEILDPNNINTIENNLGGTNSLIRIDDQKDKWPVLYTKSHNKNLVTIGIKNSFSSLFIYWNNKAIQNNSSTNSNGELTIQIPDAAKDFPRSYLRVYAANEYGISNDLLIPLEYNKVVSSVRSLTRFDKHTQIMYFLMVDRFADGNAENDFPINSPEVLPKADYQGGDLEGVIQKIDEGYFDQLGCNTIWLSPITQNPTTAYGFWSNPKTKFSAYHGYWPISSSKIDFHFGADNDLYKLVSDAHSRNMNVILDYVANHVHKDHPAIVNHPNWKTELYLPDGSLNTERWDDHRLTTWFDTFLPTLDFSKPEVVEAMTDSALFWIVKFKLDGFRHDATKHINEAFWRTLTSKIRNNVDYPIFQIGETYGSRGLIKSYISPGMLDAQFDFNVYDDAIATFAKENSSFERLSKSLSESHKYYGVNNLMGYITGNQDKPRAISYASGDVRFDENSKKAGWTRQINITDSTAFDKVFQFFTFNFTIPGIPCIYYGDEIGLPGANDPDNRRMMRFENLTKRETNLKNNVSQLAHLRRNNLSLLYGDFKEILVNKDTWVYSRSYFNETAICLFNKSTDIKSLSIPLKSDDLIIEPTFGSGYKINNQNLTIDLPPYSTEILIINYNTTK